VLEEEKKIKFNKLRNTLNTTEPTHKFGKCSLLLTFHGKLISKKTVNTEGTSSPTSYSYLEISPFAKYYNFASSFVWV
jgi:hypothetical protein